MLPEADLEAGVLREVSYSPSGGRIPLGNSRNIFGARSAPSCKGTANWFVQAGDCYIVDCDVAVGLGNKHKWPALLSDHGGKMAASNI